MDPLQAGLILMFGLAGAICLVSIRTVSKVPNADVRRGLTGLLLLSGLWAVGEIGQLLLPSIPAKELMYTFGLVAGLATVGAWLYFCSAYTGHDYHRQRLWRYLAVTVYSLVVAVKFTNPLHGLYFTTTVATEPFRHIEIHLMPAHWVVTGLAYVLTGIGFYLLYEFFSQSHLETRSLSVLVIITGLPAILDILSYTGQLLLTLNYEPLGVAIFAVGVLYVVDEQFVALPASWRQDVIEALNEPILVFGPDETIRDYNTAAADQFPDLPDAIGQPLTQAYPTLAENLTSGNGLIERMHNDTMQYFLVERQPLTLDEEPFGEIVILSDVTVIEEQRRELQRQNDQLDDFAEAITHELRNTLAIARGYLDVMGSELDAETPVPSDEYYERVTEALERMEQITSDLSTLARYGQTSQNKDTCDLQTTVERGWEGADTGEMSLLVETTGSIHADEGRLTELFRNAFEFARATGATEVSVWLDNGEIVVRNDGDALSATDIERALSYGEAVPSAETGMLLPNVRTISRAHGWEIEAKTEGTDRMTLRIKTV